MENWFAQQRGHWPLKNLSGRSVVERIHWSTCHVLTVVPFLCLCFSLVRAWVGVGILCCVFLCLAWYGSQSEAAVDRCLWLRTILRQPVFPLWFVGSCFLCLCFTIRNCFGFHLLLLFFCIQCSVISLKYGHLPRCALVRSFLLLLWREGKPSH